MYGGRAIDNFDRRVLNTYMNEYMGDFIFDTFQPFHFFMNEEVDYRIPEGETRDAYVGGYKQTYIYQQDYDYTVTVAKVLAMSNIIYMI